MPRKLSSMSSPATRLRASFCPIALVIASSLVAASCSQRLTGENGAECTVGLQMDAPRVLAACGLPNGLMEQPKVGNGSLFSLDFCSAPAYIYEKEAVLFGCDGTVDSVAQLVPDRSEHLVASPTQYLLDDIKRGGPHVAARIVQLKNQDTSTTQELIDFQQVLRDAVSSSDPFVRRAGQRVRDSRSVHVERGQRF